MWTLSYAYPLSHHGWIVIANLVLSFFGSSGFYILSCLVIFLVFCFLFIRSAGFGLIDQLNVILHCPRVVIPGMSKSRPYVQKWPSNTLWMTGQCNYFTDLGISSLLFCLPSAFRLRYRHSCEKCWFSIHSPISALYIVSCWGVVQLGDEVWGRYGSPQVVQANYFKSVFTIMEANKH